jgi:hypothetical protein
MSILPWQAGEYSTQSDIVMAASSRPTAPRSRKGNNWSNKLVILGGNTALSLVDSSYQPKELVLAIDYYV